MNNKQLRYYSDPEDSIAKNLLNKLLEDNISASDYQKAMTTIGHHLGMSLSKALNVNNKTYCVVVTAEDADNLAEGIIQSLKNSGANIFLVCLWNDRMTSPEGITSAPIQKKYYEPGFENSDELIIVKSIIASSCVVRTNITELIDKVSPKKIHIVSPVIHLSSKSLLEAEFPSTISEKFDYTYLAQDQAIDKDTGFLLPGIGGNVYQKLGFKNQTDKNMYVPELVKNNMFQHFDSEVAH